jgi:hypothetical protein
LAQALTSVRLQTGIKDKSDAMFVLAAARTAHASTPQPTTRLSPRTAAQLLLRERA